MPRGASLRRPWLSGVAAVALLACSWQAAAQQGARVQGVQDQGPAVQPTLSGCSLPLPGGADLDSGLSRLYLENRQGSRHLFAPSITLRQLYSDNVSLAPEGDEIGDWVTQLSPAFTWCRVRPRLRTQLDYEAQALYYWNEDDRNDIYHRLRSSNTATLLQERLFLDFGATYDQQTISSRGAFADDIALDTDNRTDALNVRLSPYLYQDLGPVGLSVVHYAFDRNIYDEDSVNNVTRHTGTLSIISPPEADPVTWRANVRSQRVEYSDRDRPAYFDDAFLELGYRVIGRLQLIGRVGAETEPRADGDENRFGSDYWEAGFRWTDTRTSVEARYGERFFGETYFAAISRGTARHTARLSYEETQQISDRFVLFSPEELGLPGSIVDPDTGEAIDVPPIIAAENEIFLRKRGTASSVYQTGRSTFNVSVFTERREYLVAEDEEESFGGRASWRWQWLPRTAIIPRITWERIEFRDGREDTIRGARISLAHLISPRMQAGLTVRRQDRVSGDGAGTEYTENAVAAQITRLF